MNSLLVFANEVVRPQTEDADRAAKLQDLGFSRFDALHLACAEHAEVDVFLTTDDGLLSRARRYKGALRIGAETRYPGQGAGEMTPPEKMRDEDFERHALAIPQRELGLDGLARFLRLNRAGTGDYTRDRHHWLEGATIDEIMTAVNRREKPPA